MRSCSFYNVGAVGLVLALACSTSPTEPDEFVQKDDLARAALIYRDIPVAMMQP